MKLKSFNIYKLYGYRNIEIDFDHSIKILIGENGLGKTTVLNIIYYVLSKNFSKLNTFNFESIEIIFDSKNKVIIEKEILDKHLKLDKENSSSHFNEILSKINSDQEKLLRKIIDDKSQPLQHRRLDLQRGLKNIGLNINAPTNYIFDLVQRYFDELDGNKFYDVIRKLEKNIDANILYFPTYRRIEEDIKNIGFVNRDDYNDIRLKYKKEIFQHSESNSDIIRFGMTDVEERIEEVTSKIAHSSILGFSDITADMLHQLLTDFPNVKTNNRKKIDSDKLNIILDRIGPNMSIDDRNKIKDYIKTGNTANKGLLFFIDKLIELYNKQEKQDSAIKNFVEVCNHYLTEKKYIYNEREVKLFIEHENERFRNYEGNKEISLSKLSSGEKQIVSLFSKIYLEETDKYIVLFDEPELSLSIFWQQKLLPDIVNSNKCDLLIAVTHSPFIYENKLFDYATALKDYTS